MKSWTLLATLLACALEDNAWASGSFDAGADIRIRQEILDHVPGMPGGGLHLKDKETRFRNQLRFRPRVWAESVFDTDIGKFRFYTRLTDEFRHYVHTSSRAKYRWPDEVVVDNLYLEGLGLWDGLVDFRIGRQDIHYLYDLDHIFDDGTPGDASRTYFSDVASFTFHVAEESRISLFGLYNEDDNVLRWGTDDDSHRPMTGFGGGAEPEMDDWGYGVIWGSKLAEWLPYELFVMQKNTLEFERKGEIHPWTQRNLVGTKLLPRLDEEWSLQFEAMGQIGCNGEDATLTGWYGYSGIRWKSAREGAKPFAGVGYKVMSGDEDAADEDGGHNAWDPMWARGVAESVLFAFGSFYGVEWWSNMHFCNFSTGIDFGRRHNITASCGPMFAVAQDGLGGGDGMYRGLLSQARYEFPIMLAKKEKGERLEIIGHFFFEGFHPGDYFDSKKAAWMLRWQLEIKF